MFKIQRGGAARAVAAGVVDTDTAGVDGLEDDVGVGDGQGLIAGVINDTDLGDMVLTRVNIVPAQSPCYSVRTGKEGK